MTASHTRAKEGAILGMNVFTERILVSRRCVHALVEVLKEITTKDFSELEIDTVISRILHVFQSKDAYLKLLCFAFIRSVAEMSSGAFVAINALVRTLSAKQGLRPDILKLLLQITPTAMLDDCSKYVQQSLIETEYKSLDMIVPVLLYAPEQTVSDWFTGTGWMRGLNTSGALGNAILLMSRCRPQESKDIIKLICSSYLKGYSSVLAMRFMQQYIKTNQHAQKRFYSCLKLEETDEATFIETVRSLLKMPDTDCSKYIDTSVKGLRTLLMSKCTVTRVAALRTIDMLASSPYKNKLAPLRAEVEEMLSKGSTVALLSMGILLKIGTKQVASKVAQQLPKLLAEMGEEQKLAIMESVGKLCERFGCESWVDVLKEALHSTSTCPYKVKVVKIVADVLKNTKNSDLRAKIEEILCAYVEDSPFPRVTTEILGVLLGKNTPQYKVCLMNRMILDNESVAPAIELALTAEGEQGPFSVLFQESLEAPEYLLSGTENSILLAAKEELGEDAQFFEMEKKKVSAMESKYGSPELKTSRPHILNRTESEFLITATKHIFREFIVLQYTVVSKIDCVLEEGLLSVFLGDKIVGSEKIYLRGKESTVCFIKIDMADFNQLCGQTISSAFAYTVSDNREYEEGEVRLVAYDIVPADFVAPVYESYQFTGEDTITKEFKFAMTAPSLISELKKIFDISMAEEKTNEFICRGSFIFTDDPVEVQVKVKESGSKSKAEISISSTSPEIRELLMNSIA
ncbi:coatomer subunit gamma [Nematocida homosporus]|uniref:coatomer subunit gamma n=1 Tax=Nematocida homosporus TaxID=1912981 RepID=UPI00221FD1C1|nr:coatomer subunit gamma [Nematocida homosporus]KAI5185746.1 coatomer subunit gamma [Nematocida homosporus]